MVRHLVLLRAAARSSSPLTHVAFVVLYCALQAGTGATTPRSTGEAVVLEWRGQSTADSRLGLVNVGRGNIRPHGRTVVLRRPSEAFQYEMQWSWATRRAVYLTGPGYDTRLAVADLRTGSSASLRGSAGAFYARWSPNGRQLLVIRNAGETANSFRQLTVITLDGADRGHATDLLDGVATADYTPDGGAIVFSRLFVRRQLAGYHAYAVAEPPSAIRRVYYVSAPPGASPVEIRGNDVDRLLGRAFRHALSFRPRDRRTVVRYDAPAYLAVSPRARYVCVMGTQPDELEYWDPESGAPPTYERPQAECGIVRGDGRVERFKVGGYRFTFLGWSCDDRHLYGMGGPNETELLTVSTLTGRVRREKLKPPDNWHMWVIAFQPARR